MHDQLCVIRGGGDLATGVAWRLHTAGFPVVVTELAEPLTVRRTVAVSSAVHDGNVSIEGMVAARVASEHQAIATANDGKIAVMVSPELPSVDASIVVDARLAKRNVDTTAADAALVVGLGPGFSAGRDCHAVVETMRGPRLGRCLWQGSAEPDTGVPGLVAGRGADRVLRAPAAGEIDWSVAIGETVVSDQMLGSVHDIVIKAPFDGVVRGLIRPGTKVRRSLKVGDLDPRLDTRCHEISDKALSIGGGVLEAVMTWCSRNR